MISYFMAFEGVYSIIPTAFTDSGDLDAASQRKVVDLFIDNGANGLTALGVTGEVARLEEHERRTILEGVVKQAAGRVPIIAGTSAEGTRTCIAYSRQAKDLGAAAVQVGPDTYLFWDNYGSGPEMGVRLANVSAYSIQDQSFWHFAV